MCRDDPGRKVFHHLSIAPAKIAYFSIACRKDVMRGLS
jgi:hypothetical protein